MMGVSSCALSRCRKWIDSAAVCGRGAATRKRGPRQREGAPAQRGGRDGKHTEHLGHMLTEMQIVARSFPDGTW